MARRASGGRNSRFLLFRTPLEDGQRMQPQMHGNRLAHRRVTILQRLGDDTQRNVIQPGAAIAHRQAYAQEAEFGHLGQQLMRVGMVAVMFLDDGHDFFAWKSYAIFSIICVRQKGESPWKTSLVEN